MGEWGKVYFLYDYEKPDMFNKDKTTRVRGLIAKHYKYEDPSRLMLLAMNGVRYFLENRNDRSRDFGFYDPYGCKRLKIAFDVCFECGYVSAGSDMTEDAMKNLDMIDKNPDAKEGIGYHLFAGDEFWGAMYIRYTGNPTDGYRLEYEYDWLENEKDYYDICENGLEYKKMNLRDTRDAFLARMNSKSSTEYADEVNRITEVAIRFFEENAEFAAPGAFRDFGSQAVDIVREWKTGPEKENENGVITPISGSDPIEYLDLGVRSYNCLKRNGIHTINDILALSDDELLTLRNMGRKNVDEIKEKLKEYGL